MVLRVGLAALVVMTCVGSALALGAQAGASIPQAVLNAAPQAPVRDTSRERSQTGTAVIRGRVIRVDTGAPVVQALVDLSGRPLTLNRVTQTDDQGRYEFRDLPASDGYLLSVVKRTFVRQSYGQRGLNSPSSRIALVDGQQLDSIDIALQPTGVIEGQLLDESGDPIARARVVALQSRSVDGGLQFDRQAGFGSTTDDLGRFRIYNLFPGTYYVSATRYDVVQADSRPPVFYPGTASASDAQSIVLGMGQIVSGIAIQLSPTRLISVSGTVTTSTGRPAHISSLTFTNGTSREPFRRPDGSFLIPNVVPGEYQIAVQTTDNEALYTRVTIGAVDVALLLVTKPPVTVRGRITFDGERPRGMTPFDMSLTVSGVGGWPGTSARIADDWTFQATVLGPGMIRTGAARPSPTNPRPDPSASMLKRVTRDGVDVTDTPIDFGSAVDDLEVVLTTAVSGVAGTVKDGGGAPAADAVVVLFADDRGRWGRGSRFVRWLRVDRGGQFIAAGLPAGRYCAAALSSLEPGDEQNPAVLEALSRDARRLEIREGEMLTMSLTLQQ